jgi:flagellar hook-length control protein FliK
MVVPGAAPVNAQAAGPGLAMAKPAGAATGVNATGLTARADAPHGAPPAVVEPNAAVAAASEVFSVNGKADQAAGASTNMAAASSTSAPAGTLVDASALASQTSGANTVAAPVAASVAGSVAATPSALAAAVTAMHQAGQASTVLRLDPVGLGALSVHIGLGAQGQVNVLFVPGTAQAAQLLNAGMGDLRHAMAASGLMLGQAQVGGQSNGQSSGQNSGQSSGQNTPQPRGEAPNTAAVSGDNAVDPASGVRAYA